MHKPWYARWQHISEFNDSPAYSVEVLKGIARDVPDKSCAWRRLGVLLGGLARYAEAEAALTRALELCAQEQRVFVLCDLGDLERKRGCDVAAELWFRRAIDESPDDASGE